MDVKNIDFSKLKKLIPYILIIVAIIFSAYYRSFAISLSITDEWAKSTMDKSIKNQITESVRTQYPNLPEAQLQQLIANNFDKVIKENKADYENQIKLLSNEFKDKLKDENGYVYLSDIDTYYWYTQTKNIIDHGNAWDIDKDGQHLLSVRNGRFGLTQAFNLHPYLQAFTYKILHFFNRDITVMRACFLMSFFLIGISVILAFLIGKHIAGDIGGFFAAMIIAINQAVLARTMVGVSDTDAYQVLFPLLIMWLYLMALDNKKYGFIFAIASGVCVVLYTLIWPGAAYVLLLIYGSAILYLIYSFITKKKEIIKNQITCLIAFFVSSFSIIAILKGPMHYINAYIIPISFLKIKEVATKTIWPNVMTTVAEFNEMPMRKIIVQMGGNLIFLAAIVGLILLIILERKHLKYSFFIIPWFLATIVPFSQGVRFAMLLVPPFAIAVGICFNTLYTKISEWTEKNLHIHILLSQIVIFMLCFMLIVPQFSTARKVAESSIPYVDDAWYNSLIKIRDSSIEGHTIITSWWDFGHWFGAIAERSTTFDGAKQGKRIYWVGKVLLTNNEDKAMTILRMLNCGQEKSYDELFKIYKDEYVTTKKLLELLDGRKSTQEEQWIYDQYINCNNLYDNYFIASEDMVGKAGVWSHFGGWEFDKAKLYNEAKKMDSIQGTDYIKSSWNVSTEQAGELYYQIQTIEADKWISDWPGYEGIVGCGGNQTLTCGQIKINMTDMDTIITSSDKHPKSISYMDKNNSFTVKQFNETTEDISVILYRYSGDYYIALCSPVHVDSLFTRLFFFEGQGLEHFIPFSHDVTFTGENIYVYKINFSNDNPNREQVNALKN